MSNKKRKFAHNPVVLYADAKNKTFDLDIINKYNDIIDINIDSNITNVPPLISGVYFLFNDIDLVYIGKSNNIYFRIITHIGNDRIVFDKYSYVKIDGDYMSIVEAVLIKYYKPKHNSSWLK